MVRAPLRGVVTLALAAAALRSLSSNFLVAPGKARLPTPLEHASSNAVVASVGGGLAAGVAAAPAHAEEAGLLNFGKIELGGGFAINLDIPETGIINIVVLIAGLIYLLGPLLSNSMETREAEISQDINDAIAKWEEANARLAEAQKNEAQAEQVIAEIEASIDKDKADFKKTIEESTADTLKKQAAATESLIAQITRDNDSKYESYIERASVEEGVKELMSLDNKKKDEFMMRAINSL